MTIWDSIILGIVQGLTEFLPVSSSGHLVIGEALLGIHKPGISLEIWLHFGTLLAVIVYFFRRLRDLVCSLAFSRKEESAAQDRILLAGLIVGTVPAVVIGLLLKSTIETAFASPKLTGGMLLVTGVILLSTVPARNRDRVINLPRALAVGLAQALAIFPGISRSGSTIACAMHMGVKPAEAAEFSFLLAVPAIGGAFVYNLITSGENISGDGDALLYFLGMSVAFISGLLSIHYLLKIIRKGRFFVFGFYCLVVGAISLIFIR